MKSWYLIHTKPQQEQVAKENLERQNYIIYLPMMKIRSKRRGRTISVIDPLFPRYLFIYLSDKTDNWQPLRSTIGVTTVVKFGMEPAKVPDTLIEDIRQRENQDGLHESPKGEYTQGQQVRITEGPMEGYEGLFHAKNGEQRVVLLLNIAENTARIQVYIDKIEPAS